MRIAFLSPIYPFRGGIAQFSTSLYKELEKHHTVKAFTFSTQYPNFLFPGKSQYVNEDEDTTHVESFPVLNSINPISYYTTARKILAFKPDLVVLRYWMTFFGPSLGTVARRLNRTTKVISIVDNVVPHEKRFFDTPFTNYFLKPNHGFIAMSKSVVNDLVRLKPDANYLFKPHPLYDHFGEKIDKAEARKKLKLNPNKKTLLFFGIIRKYKGLDILLKAFNQLDDSYQIIIAGEAYEDFEQYNQLREQSKNKQNIHFHNRYISDEEVPLFFSASDVCVLPYRSATQSGITAISYHFNLPLIATKVGGLHEVVKHNETGLIVDECKPDIMTKAIKEYFNENKANEFQENIKVLKKELSWESFANSLVEFSNTLK